MHGKLSYTHLLVLKPFFLLSRGPTNGRPEEPGGARRRPEAPGEEKRRVTVGAWTWYNMHQNVRYMNAMHVCHVKGSCLPNIFMPIATLPRTIPMWQNGLPGMDIVGGGAWN